MIAFWVGDNQREIEQADSIYYHIILNVRRG